MSIRIAQVEGEDQIEQLRALLSDYVAFLRDLQKDTIPLSTPRGLQNVNEELATLPGIFVPPKGYFLVALNEAQVIGCIALQPISEGVGELKRMYVKSAYRGQQVGWRLLETLVSAARDAGYRRIFLDSHFTMHKAHSLYQQVGFKVVAPPADTPEPLKATVIFMELNLGDTTLASSQNMA